MLTNLETPNIISRHIVTFARAFCRPGPEIPTATGPQLFIVKSEEISANRFQVEFGVIGSLSPSQLMARASLAGADPMGIIRVKRAACTGSKNQTHVTSPVVAHDPSDQVGPRKENIENAASLVDELVMRTLLRTSKGEPNLIGDYKKPRSFRVVYYPISKELHYAGLP